MVKWIALGAWVGVLSGVSSAFFLWSLDLATKTRGTYPWLLFLLPLGGVGIALLYHHFGKQVEAGNNLLLERIHEPGEVIPFRMAPLILLTTVATHLFGGSAGREGTAVQMGGTLGQLAASPLKLPHGDRRLLIMAGISGGFGAVFGTPFAGAIFGMEVLMIGRIRYDALIPCLVASIVGDAVCRGLGIHHHLYRDTVGTIPPLGPAHFGLLIVAGICFAGASALFSHATHWIGDITKKQIKPYWLRPALGGVAIIALTFAVGNRDYNGLSLPLIQASFLGPVLLGAFLLKILFTAVTLGTGFKGGEVTPLFCIGAALGNAFAQVTHQPVGYFAALGFAAVFAGAANTPLACAIMGVELFGGDLALPLAVTCVIAYLLSGHRGIYSAQRVDHPKPIP